MGNTTIRHPFQQFLVGIVILLAQRNATAYQFTTLASLPGGELIAPSGALATDGTYLYGTSQGAYPNGGAVFRVGLDGSGLVKLRNLNQYDTGYNPYGGVTVANSKLFAVKFRGGPPTNSIIGSGTVFSMDLDGTGHQILQTFGSPAAPSLRPHETVVVVDSTLYGTTTGQLVHDFGSIYSVSSDGSNFKVLHEFNGADGSYPVTRLLPFGDRLFGATAGFAVPGYNGGTIFSIRKDGTDFKVLHALSNVEGNFFQGDLAIVGDSIYGVATDGGANDGGIIFRLNLNCGGFQTLHSFPSDAAPQSGLTYLSGRLFGTTSSSETIFSIKPDGSQFTTVHTFSSATNPVTRLLAVGSTLYGTTEGGGATGNGTVFSLTVPEPAGASLCSFACFGLAMLRWRQRVS